MAKKNIRFNWLSTTPYKKGDIVLDIIGETPQKCRIGKSRTSLRRASALQAGKKP